MSVTQQPTYKEARSRRAASPKALRQMIGRSLASAGIHRVRTGMLPRPGYEILGGGGDGMSVYAVVRYSTDDDGMIRRCGRVLRSHSFAVTYFRCQGRPMLRVDADVW